jgi:glucose-6-phosphate 1-epimerase
VPNTSSPSQMHGQPAVVMQLAAGDTVVVALQGAQVLSWQTADGTERLYLSPKAAFDGKSPIRGGIPVCFPQFNQRVLDGCVLAKHGFARTLPWTVRSVDCEAQSALAVFTLSHDALPEELRLDWPHHFEAQLDVALTPAQLRVTFNVRNTGAHTWPFALALHSYLGVTDITQTRLQGLQGVPFWDAVAHGDNRKAIGEQGDVLLGFVGETDRVYQRVPAALQLLQPDGKLRIEQSAAFSETVVWNPGAKLCAQLADLPDDGYRRMLCVEAAAIDHAVALAPGQCWHGWQQFGVF